MSDKNVAKFNVQKAFCLTKSSTVKKLERPPSQFLMIQGLRKSSIAQKVITQKTPPIMRSNTAGNNIMSSNLNKDYNSTRQKHGNSPVKSNIIGSKNNIQKDIFNFKMQMPQLHNADHLIAAMNKGKTRLAKMSTFKRKGSDKNVISTFQQNESIDANFEEAKEGVVSEKIRSSCTRQIFPLSSKLTNIIQAKSDTSTAIEDSELVQKNSEKRGIHLFPRATQSISINPQADSPFSRRATTTAIIDNIE